MGDSNGDLEQSLLGEMSSGKLPGPGNPAYGFASGDMNENHYDTNSFGQISGGLRYCLHVEVKLIIDAHKKLIKEHIDLEKKADSNITWFLKAVTRHIVWTLLMGFFLTNGGDSESVQTRLRLASFIFLVSLLGITYFVFLGTSCFLMKGKMDRLGWMVADFKRSENELRAMITSFQRKVAKYRENLPGEYSPQQVDVAVLNRFGTMDLPAEYLDTAFTRLGLSALYDYLVVVIIIIGLVYGMLLLGTLFYAFGGFGFVWARPTIA